MNIKTRLALLGPGMLFAASAVGVSHLVQSTRAGADYGLTLTPLLLLACLIKYPAFRFGNDFAAITGRSLLHGYQNQGRLVLFLFLLVLPVDMFIATAAVSLVTAGLILNIFPLKLNITAVTFSVLAVCSLTLIIGKYRLFESIIKVFVLLFSLITALATVVVVPRLVFTPVDLTPALSLDKTTIFFIIAAAGWMPTAITASVFQSLWVCARQQSGREKLTLKSSRFDFNTGYIVTTLLAVCFVLMGSGLFHTAGVSLPPRASDFAGQLITMFSSLIGAWLYPVISLAALAVMISTVMTLLDAGPRAANDALNRLGKSSSPDKADAPERNFYGFFLLLQLMVSMSMLLLFLTSFKEFIDFATSVAFLTAPILAFFNHLCICDPASIPRELRPGALMRAWSFSGICIMLGIAVCYLCL